jgi:hypothetical protein
MTAAPMLNDIDITYSEWQFDGTFPDKHSNIYRQDPSPAVDEAWESMGLSSECVHIHSRQSQTDTVLDRVVIISEEEGPKAGLSPINHVQVNKKYGGGYPVLVEGLHHLHCLVRPSASPSRQIDTVLLM